MRKKRNNQMLRILSLCAVVLCTAAVLCGWCVKEVFSGAWNETETADASQAESAAGESTNATEEVTSEQEVEMTAVELYCLHVQLPEEMAQLLKWEEIPEDDAHVTAAVMETDGRSWELYRVCFGDGYAETALGTMNVDGQQIPVALINNAYDSELFPDDETLEVYSYVMESLQYVMSAIRSDDRFQREADVTVEKNETTVGYWDFEILDEMECITEKNDDAETYVFYGTVNGKEYQMYTVCVGDTTLSSVLGTMTLDGAVRLISIESCEPPSVEGWPEAEVNKLYMMMDSINDVIRTITESDGFSAPEVEEN